ANNAPYGMTGGQMAPTTLLGQKATTAQEGRNTIQHGNPMHVSEIFATIDRAAYVERVALTDIGNIRKAKKAIKKAFTYQIEKKGFTLIEVVSTCPVNWGMKPREALDWAKEHMIPIYPLGVYKDIEKND
ncbi:MAG: thiamine pyrophosphate-dependent enzyme, partial [Acholeplasmataceae bacterium]|nr:thiamine pyrophosphate-dependent enzyme [Acholeplasmataceae bacterium]